MLRRFSTRFFGGALVVVALLTPTRSFADSILGFTGITSPQGSFGGLGGLFELSNAINQSGLSATYTSGVTDFASFVATTTHNSNPAGFNSGFTNTQAPPGQFSLDLGAAVAIDALAFWDTQESGSVHQFRLYADTNNVFGDGGLILIGTFSATGGGFGEPQPVSAQVFTFAPITTRFLHIDVINMQGGTNLIPGIGELAARSAAPVPEPATLTLVGLGLAVAWCYRRRRGGNTR